MTTKKELIDKLQELYHQPPPTKATGIEETLKEFGEVVCEAFPHMHWSTTDDGYDAVLTISRKGTSVGLTIQASWVGRQLSRHHFEVSWGPGEPERIETRGAFRELLFSLPPSLRRVVWEVCK